MAIDKAFLDTLRDRLSIVEAISKYVPLKRSGKENWGVCPFHGEKTASFSVNEDKQFYHCFGCGAHGDIINFTMQFLHMTFIEAVEKLASEAGLEMPQSTPEQRDRDRRSHDMHEILMLACEFYQRELYSDTGAEALAYLRRRHLDDTIIANFRLGFAPAGNRLLKYLENKHVSREQMLEAGLARKSEHDGSIYDYFRNRVLFPITDSKGRVVAFGGRVMDDSLPKYLNSPENLVFQKGRSLYALSQARIAAAASNEVIACEGYMDTIALHKFGFKNALAPLGTAITETQIELLWKLAAEPILCFDSDEAGRRAGVRAALRALPLLRPGKSLKFCLIEGAKDPDEYLHSFGHDKFADMLAGSLSLSEILWRYFTSGRKIETPEARAGLQDEIAKEFARMKNETVRRFYMDDFNLRMRREFSRIPVVKRSFAPKSNPENPNEKMVLAFAILYPSMFLKFLEEGRSVALGHPVYKKVFDAVVAEVSLNPHTRETLMRALNERGFHPENLLKFELAALAAKPDKAAIIMEEKLLGLRREGLQGELRALAREILSAAPDRQEVLRGKIAHLNAEIASLDERLERLGGIA